MHATWVLSAAVALFVAGVVHSKEPCCLDDLKRLSACELSQLYTQAEIGTPFTGDTRGALLVLDDGPFKRVRISMSNSIWKGKSAQPDGQFTNLWIAGRRGVDSQYVIGESWYDGRPTLIMEYPGDSRIFANAHDELREIAPGLWMGPYYRREPTPKLRGFIALEAKR